MRIAIDLLWLRPSKVGGTEAYIRNLLKGIQSIKEDYRIFLLLSMDNQESFKDYFKDTRFSPIICNIKSSNIMKRIIWQNLFQSKKLLQYKIDTCFVPVYSMPLIKTRKIKYICTIHDLQALHFPTYQSKLKVLWLKISWRNTLSKATKVVAISDFVKEDIEKRFSFSKGKVLRIYNPVVIDIDNIYDFSLLRKKYLITENEYLYTVSSLLPHKNLETIIKLLYSIKNEHISLPNKLVISGIGGKSYPTALKMIQEFDLVDNVVLTGFVTDSERNSLYKNSFAFLFPSIFEGFGMPPIEAAILNAKVITTKKTSLHEVTCGKANYVQNPYDVIEWVNELFKAEKIENTEIFIEKYNETDIAIEYLRLFKLVQKSSKKEFV